VFTLEYSVLIVDDDKNICTMLELYLPGAGFKTIYAHDGSEALNIFNNNNLDIILLDLMLPIINGIEVCKIIRQTSNIPIIMLTARDMIEDKLIGFENGADDYIIKPFDPREVIVRIKARLKNIEAIIEPANKHIISIGNFSMDISKYEVMIDNCILDLKPKEIQLLHFLITNKNLVFSREKLLDKVWNYEFAGDTRTVDVHINRLRENIEGKCPLTIKTIWGVGYKLEVCDV